MDIDSSAAQYAIYNLRFAWQERKDNYFKEVILRRSLSGCRFPCTLKAVPTGLLTTCMPWSFQFLVVLMSRLALIFDLAHKHHGQHCDCFVDSNR